MTKYELWLKSCTGKDKDLNLLEKKGDIKLFQLVHYNRTGKKYENNYNSRQISYHIWNVVTGEWLVLDDCRSAVSKYNNLIKEK